MVFRGDPGGVRAMREWLTARIAGHSRADDIELVATELASNATRHTASKGWLFVVAVERGAGTRVTVEDLGSAETEPVMGNAGVDDMHGHGLALVAELSDSWGCHGDHTGRDVWARWNVAS